MNLKQDQLLSLDNMKILKMKKITILILTFFYFGKIEAQQLPQISQYMLNNYAINPAVSAMYDYYQVKTTIRNQWTGLSESPKTTILSIYGKKNEKVALGGTVFNDITGPTSRIGGTISYAYTLPINGKLNFSLAISGGFTQFRLIKSTISVQQADDPFIQGGDIVRTLPDAIFALNFFTEKWYLGLSVPQLLSTELNLMDEDFARRYDTTSVNGKLSSHVFVLGEYIYVINKDFTFKPNLFLKYVSGSKTQIDLGVKTEYKQLLWTGVNYNINNQLSPLGLLLGYNISDKFNIGYSFGVPSSSTSSYQSGSHEFMLGFKFF